jgi:DNA-binding MarR family transcriptional regulator
VGQGADAAAVADALATSIGLLHRRLRQVPVEGDLSFPERAALTRLDRGGPTTSADLARLEQISPQSMGATLAALEVRGLITRRPDPDDGRRVVLSVTAAGEQALRERRTARRAQLATALSAAFTAVELRELSVAAPLLERLAERL